VFSEHVMNDSDLNPSVYFSAESMVMIF
jgi:hypothetical protein